MAEKIEVVIVDETGGQSQPSPPGTTPGTTPGPTPGTTPGTTPGPTPARPSQGAPGPSTAPTPQTGSRPPTQPQANSGGSLPSQIINGVQQVVTQAGQNIIQPLQTTFNGLLQLPGRLLSGLRNLIPNSIREGMGALLARIAGPAKTAASNIWDKVAAKQRAQIIALLKALLVKRGGELPGPLRPRPLQSPQRPGSLPTVPPRPRGSMPAAARSVGTAATGARAAGAAAGSGGASAATGTAAAGVGALASNPVGWVIAAIIVAFSALIIATVGLVKTFKSQEQELRDVSGEISGALAVREVRRIESQIDRNERFGSDIAQFSMVWTNFEDALYNLITEILDLLVPFLPMIEVILESITLTIALQRQQLALLNVISEMIDAMVGGWMTDETVGEAIQNFFDAQTAVQQAMDDLMTFNNRPSQTSRLFGNNPFQNNSRPITPGQFNPPLPPRPGNPP